MILLQCIFFQNPVVIVKEIEILGIATSHHTIYPINSDKDLLTCIICKCTYISIFTAL
jgi:hypothetical protein